MSAERYDWKTIARAVGLAYKRFGNLRVRHAHIFYDGGPAAEHFSREHGARAGTTDRAGAIWLRILRELLDMGYAPDDAAAAAYGFTDFSDTVGFKVAEGPPDEAPRGPCELYDESAGLTVLEIRAGEGGRVQARIRLLPWDEPAFYALAAPPRTSVVLVNVNEIVREVDAALANVPDAASRAARRREQIAGMVNTE